ncbi:MAG: hypothetical protein ABFD20_10945 [Anaerolineales bacterium]
MALRQRIWLCTALGSAGGFLASGLARWSGQALFPVIALWVICGLLMAPVVAWMQRCGRLLHRAAEDEAVAACASLPYARAGSPAAHLSAALAAERRTAGADRPLANASVGALSAAIAAALLASLLAQDIAALLYVGMGIVLLLAFLVQADSAAIVVLTATVWGAASGLSSSLRGPQLLAGVLAAVLLVAATQPTPGKGWRAIAMVSTGALGLFPAVGQQPALAGLVWVAALFTLSWPADRPASVLARLTVGICTLVVGLGVGHWG